MKRWNQHDTAFVLVVLGLGLLVAADRTFGPLHWLLFAAAVVVFCGMFVAVQPRSSAAR